MSGLKVIFSNVRSITNKFDEFYALVEDVKPSIIGVTETWLNDSYSDAEFAIPNYILYRQDRADTVRGIGGGVLLYIKQDLNSVQREDLQGAFTNYVWCEVQVGGAGFKRSQLLIGVVYRSPNSTSANDQLLFNIINGVSSQDTIIMGDFNYPDISWDDGTAGAKGRDFFNLLQDAFLHQHVLFPTRGDNILDLVLSSDPNIIREVVGLGKIGSSDHDAIGFNVVVNQVAARSTEVVPNFRKSDVDGIADYLSNIDWDNCFHGLNASDCCDYFLSVIEHIGDNFVPKHIRRQ